MAPDSDLLGLTDIARLAGVRRNVVANWRDRHTDFPQPAEQPGSGPLYRRDEVAAWLEANRPQAKKVQPLGFEAQLWKAADALRNNMDAAEYKHVVLGLIFLKYISDSFEERRAEILAMTETIDSDYFGDTAAAEDRDEYLSKHVFWVPEEARWSKLRDAAKQPAIGKLVDEAMVAIERDNLRLKGVLPKDYARPTLDWQRLGQLVDLISGIGVGGAEARDHDVLGRVYEYFLGRFASAEGKGAGQFYTPRSVVRLLVEMMEPYHGRIYDPCCGSGGMFVQSVKFIEAHGGKRSDLAIYGQESNPTTWRLAAMNLAIRGIEANLGPEHADTFRRDVHPDLKADFVIANPPFNDSHWNGEMLRDDVRWKYGVPPVGNANFAWVQHFVHHLAPRGVAGFVLANGSLASWQGGEGEIRQALVEADVVDCIVALPPQLFYSTQIRVCLWFLARDKSHTSHGRAGHTLFIDAQRLGSMVDRTHRDFIDEDLARIVSTYRAWRTGDQVGYADQEGFCRSVPTREIAEQRYALNPGFYVTQAGRARDAVDVVNTVERRLATAVRSADRARGQFSAAFKEAEILDDPSSEGDWQTVPLSSIARFVNGGAYTKGASGTGRVVVRIAEMTGGLGPSTVYSEIQVGDDQVARRGDLLFAWSGSLVVSRWLLDDAVINQHIFKVIPNPGVPPWLVHAHLLRLLPEFRRIAADKATTMGHIQRHHLDVEVNVPLGATLARLDAICAPLWDWNLEQEASLRLLRQMHDLLLPALASGAFRAESASDNDEAAM